MKKSQLPENKKKSSADRKALKLSKALVAAAFEGNEERVAELLSLGASTIEQQKIRDAEGDLTFMTPLMAAAYGARAGCFFQLLPASDVLAQGLPSKNDGNGRDALMRSLQGGSPEIIDALIPLATVSLGSFNKRSALGYAAFCGRASAIEALLARGWSPNMQTIDGSTPLMDAIACSRSENPSRESDFPRVVELLFAATNSNFLEKTNRNGYTAFHLSIMNDEGGSIAELLWSEAAQAKLTPNGRCGAMLAAEFDRVALLKKMLPFADLAKVDGVNWTLLEIAAQFSSAQCLSLLLDAGVDLSVRLASGGNVLMKVVSPDIEHDTPTAIAEHRRKSLLAARLLAPLGTLALDADINGRTALMMSVAFVDDRNASCACQGIEIAKILLPWSDPSFLDLKSLSALDLAISSAASHWPKLNKNPPTPQENSSQEDDIHALSSYFSELLEVIDTLADLAAAAGRNCAKETPLMFAIRMKSPAAVIQILLRHFNPKDWIVENGVRMSAAEVAAVHSNAEAMTAIASARDLFEQIPASHGFAPMPSILDLAMARAGTSFGTRDWQRNATILDALFELPATNFHPTPKLAILALSSGHERWALRALSLIDVSSLASTPALSWAARMGSASCVQLLASQAGLGMWLNGLSPLAWAARAASPECLALLLPEYNPQEALWSGDSLLENVFDISADPAEEGPVAERQARCVEILLAAGSGGEAKAFYAALRTKNMPAAEMLAAKAFASEGLPALMAVAKSGCLGLARLMVAAGAENGIDRRGQDIFDEAVWRYRNTSATKNDLKEDILALINIFGINSSATRLSLDQRFKTLFQDDPNFIDLLVAMSEAENIAQSLSPGKTAERPARRL